MTAPLCFMRALALTSLLLLVVGCNGGDEASPGTAVETWRFAIEETQGSVQDAYAQEFKKRIEERSGGAIEVKVYPYGTLGTSDDITEQLRMGSVQFAMASPGHLGKTIPEVQVFLLHFLFSDDNEVNRAALADPAFLAELEPLYAARGMKLLSVYPEGWMVWTTKKSVRRPEDFAGVKMRTMTSPLLLEAYTAYGASPQAMPYSEVYSGLQLNMIDGQVNPVFAIEEMSFYEVTSHMIFGKHAQFITTAVTSPAFFDGLSPERQQLVEEVIAELNPHIFEVQRRYNAERVEEIQKKKPDMEMIKLIPEEREAFRQLSLPVRDTFLETTGDSGKRVLEALTAALARAEKAAAEDVSGDDGGGSESDR